jgi:hypothetical protein
MFSESDLAQINARGSDVEQVKQQIQYFTEGFPFLPLSKAATIGDGILRLTDEEISTFVELFEQKAQEGEISLLKFVPASGAATRMFKSLFSFLEEGKSDKLTEEFFERLADFAFYKDLTNALAVDGFDVKTADRKTIAEYFLTDKGLGYGSLPKGLLEFHSYPSESRTPLEEHLVEG